MEIDITDIVKLIVSLLSLIVTGFLIPYIANNIKDSKLKNILKWVNIAVRAAEMIFKGSGRGAEKKEYVLKFLKRKGCTLDMESLENLIESSVLELNSTLKGVVNDNG